MEIFTPSGINKHKQHSIWNLIPNFLIFCFNVFNFVWLILYLRVCLKANAFLLSILPIHTYIPICMYTLRMHSHHKQSFFSHEQFPNDNIESIEFIRLEINWSCVKCHIQRKLWEEIKHNSKWEKIRRIRLVFRSFTFSCSQLVSCSVCPSGGLYDYTLHT